MFSRLTLVAFLTAVPLTGCRRPQDLSKLADEDSFRSPPKAVASDDSSQRTVEDAIAFDLPAAPALDDYLEYAALHNPGLKAAFNKWRAAVLQAPQVSSLPDPRLNYRYFIREVETRVGPQKHGIGLSQTFPWFGTLSLREQAALKAAEAEYQQFEQARLDLYYQVKRAYADYWELGRSIRIVAENLKLAEHFESVVRIRYTTAAANHPDMIRVQVELARLIDRQRSLEQLRPAVVARLNAAMNRPIDAPLPMPTSIPAATTTMDDRRLVDSLMENNPRLKALDRMIESHKARIDLARKAYYPDVTLGVDYINVGDSTAGRHPPDDGKDAVVGMLSVNLPIWYRKLNAGVEQAQHNYVEAVANRHQRANDLKSRLAMALFRLQDARRKVKLYQDTLLPKAEESVKVYEAAFRNGTAGFLDLIDAQRVLLEFGLAEQEARAEQLRRLAEIEMLTGAPLPMKPAANPAPDVSR